MNLGEGLYIVHLLSYPKFWTLSIERVWFLFLIVWQWKLAIIMSNEILSLARRECHAWERVWSTNSPECQCSILPSPGGEWIGIRYQPRPSTPAPVRVSICPIAVSSGYEIILHYCETQLRRAATTSSIATESNSWSTVTARLLFRLAYFWSEFLT